MSDTDFETSLNQLQARANAAIALALGDLSSEYEMAAASYLGRLFDASAYALNGGGKRVRPALVYAAAKAINANVEPGPIDTVACSVELIHAYSLVHDDLPAMDNDELRRGLPSTHKAYDEATAVLVGDALQARAFELLANETGFSSDTRIDLLQSLSAASGMRGMVGGQAIDIAAVGVDIDLAHLQAMHGLKTGALIRASVAMGAIAAGADQHQLQQLDTYASAIGLAFQVCDDLLDATSSTEDLGKSARADEVLNKPTYVTLLGVEGAQNKAAGLLRDAENALADTPADSDLLISLARYIVARQH